MLTESSGKGNLGRQQKARSTTTNKKNSGECSCMTKRHLFFLILFLSGCKLQSGDQHREVFSQETSSHFIGLIREWRIERYFLSSIAHRNELSHANLDLKVSLKIDGLLKTGLKERLVVKKSVSSEKCQPRASSTYRFLNVNKMTVFDLKEGHWEFQK